MNKKELEELHEQAVSKFNEYIAAKEKFKEEDYKKVQHLKDKWHLAWNELMESLLILERIEI